MSKRKRFGRRRANRGTAPGHVRTDAWRHLTTSEVARLRREYEREQRQAREALDVFEAMRGLRDRANVEVMGWTVGREAAQP